MHNIELRFSGEDSFRSDFDNILKLYSTIDKLGVNRVGIADTVGFAIPMEVERKSEPSAEPSTVISRPIFTNDTGCAIAIANAYCALESGATHTDTTVLGIGEHNGISPLGGLMACLETVDRKSIEN